MLSFKVPRTICCDFDGTICEFAFPNIGKPKPFVKEALSVLRHNGFKVIISSCRTCNHHPDIFSKETGGVLVQGKYGKFHLDMVDWLNSEGIPYDEVDDGTRGKVMADYYIDDKGVFWEDDWGKITKWILEKEGKII